MATTIWSGLNANLIRYDVSYDASRPDPYGDQVNITFHLHTYKRDGTVSFSYDLVWDAMWCMGSNWSGGQQIKANNVAMGEYWNDCSATVYTANDYVTGVRFIAGSRYNDGSSGRYDTGSDINISVPAKQIVNTPATAPNDGAIYSTNNSSGVHRDTITDTKANEVWWNWWGQANGSPDSNVIDHYAVAISKTNDSNTAASISSTSNYVQNTHISISSLLSSYSANAGDTLYCWVNTCTRGGSWLGRQYLGAIKVTEATAPDIEITTTKNKYKVTEAIALKWTMLTANYDYTNYFIEARRYNSQTNTWTNFTNIHDLYSSYSNSFSKTTTTTNVTIKNLFGNVFADDRFSFRIGVISASKSFQSPLTTGIYLDAPKERGLLYKDTDEWKHINPKNRKYKDTNIKSNINIILKK